MNRITFLIITFFFFATSVLATTATPSAVPTETIDKIKNLVKENVTATELDIQKEAAGKSLLGYTGKVKTVGTKNITIETEKDLLQILISEESTIFKGTSQIKTSSIAIGDNLLVYGQKNEDNVFEGKHLYVLAPLDETNIVISKTRVSTINKIDLKKKTFTLIIDGQETNFTLSRKNTVKLEDFKDGDTILGITKKYQGKFSLSKAIKL
ncbi:hypothetical protein A2572_00420 [Candidatus Collierbacteria bacterium RIFOXYD1_FULL_40_9]|uniref:DUF5666 domain-containing protein n=1 Tax=Candidatus Collierbacteria bacterium RIFOXYD1_FULL_40_9 TaxID=1817731 RepID=A0A1F5FVB6_9BACT|nr:MAG: hypothetical protein A2572_00420 [Candidatus Collierbacteria bacterium RIFOXYD1_FULL_40_9]